MRGQIGLSKMFHGPMFLPFNEVPMKTDWKNVKKNKRAAAKRRQVLKSKRK